MSWTSSNNQTTNTLKKRNGKINFKNQSFLGLSLRVFKFVILRLTPSQTEFIKLRNHRLYDHKKDPTFRKKKRVRGKRGVAGGGDKGFFH